MARINAYHLHLTHTTDTQTPRATSQKVYCSRFALAGEEARKQAIGSNKMSSAVTHVVCFARLISAAQKRELNRCAPCKFMRFFFCDARTTALHAVLKCHVTLVRTRAYVRFNFDAGLLVHGDPADTSPLGKQAGL